MALEFGGRHLIRVRGGPFLLRLSYVRSHVLSVALALLGLHLLLKRREKALFALGFVYAWSYTFPFVLFPSSLNSGPPCRMAWLYIIR